MPMPMEFLSSAPSFGGGGLSANGGDAAPSGVTASQSVSMSSPFSFASGGSKASASADQAAPSAFSSETLILWGFFALLGAVVVRKSL